MARNNDIYRVPAELRQDYNLLVQKANRQIMKNLKFIQKEDIKDHRVHEALLGAQVDHANWHTQKTPFSRSVVFRSRTTEDGRKITAEQQFKSYMRTLERYSERNIEEVREGYYKNIIKSLTTLAIETGNLDEKGKLPANLARRIKNLSTEQLIHFFDDDPTERIEGLRWGSDDYEGADMEQFVDVTVGHLKALRQIYPKPRKPRSDKGKKRGPRKPKKK